jgi:hypothetical protein
MWTDGEGRQLGSTSTVIGYLCARNANAPHRTRNPDCTSPACSDDACCPSQLCIKVLRTTAAAIGKDYPEFDHAGTSPGSSPRSRGSRLPPDACHARLYSSPGPS